MGPSRINSWYQYGGETPELGGAVIVQVVPAQVNAGKIVRAPIAFPWVLDDAVLMIDIVIGVNANIMKTHQQEGIS